MNAKEIVSTYGLPPMQAPSATATIEWNGFLLDWGICGKRGNPDTVAYLRGVKRLIPGTDPLRRMCDGPYIAASALRSVAP